MNRASNSCCGILALCLVTVAVLSRHTSADRSSYRSNDEDYPGGSQSAASIDHDDMCGNLRAQSELDIQQMTGIWSGNELLHHDSADPDSNATKVCIIVQISQEMTTVRPIVRSIDDELNQHRQQQQQQHSSLPATMLGRPPFSPKHVNSMAQPTPSVYKKQLGQHPPVSASQSHYHPDDQPQSHDRHSYEYLRLIWDDSRIGYRVEYVLHYNHTSRGVWQTGDPMSDTYAAAANGGGFYHSEQAGVGAPQPATPPQTTFLVMKAVGNHVVLTMCQTVPAKRLVSITLSRETEPIDDEVLASVRNLLRRRHLSIYSTTPLCTAKNAATPSTGYGSPLTMASCLNLLVFQLVATIWSRSC